MSVYCQKCVSYHETRTAKNFMSKAKTPNRVRSSERVVPPPKRDGYKANFLRPHKYESVEAMGWEFANANTEAYRKLVWRELLKRARRHNDKLTP